jgi:hypothetical protein
MVSRGSSSLSRSSMFNCRYSGRFT